MKTMHNSRIPRLPVVLAVLLPVLLAAGAALADDDERLEAARAALNEARYQHAAQLYAEAREQAEAEQAAAEALYWEAFARYRLERTHELKESLELLRLHAERYSDASSAAEAEALAARVVGELARRGEADAAREIYEQASEERQRDHTRIAALHALSRMDPDKALPILEKVLRNETKSSPEMRQTAVVMLCQIDRRGVDILLEALPTLKDPDVLQSAVLCLGQRGDDRVLDAILAVMERTDDPEITRTLVLALGHLRNERALDVLVAIVRDEDRDPELRSQAIVGMAQTNQEQATDVLLQIVAKAEEDPEVVEMAIMALGRIDDPTASAALLDIARNPAEKEELRAQALYMAGIHGHVAAEDLRQIYTSTDSRDMKVQIYHVLTQLEDEATAFTVFMEILEKEEDPDVRHEAVFWVGQFEDPRAVEYLMNIIEQK